MHNSFFLSVLPFSVELFRDNPSPVFRPGVNSNFHGFDLGLKFLYYVLSKQSNLIKVLRQQT